MRVTYQPDDSGRDQYEVLSDSGTTYIVRFCGSGDGDPEFCSLWECNCPAGQHGRDCKHVRAVAGVISDEPIEIGTVLSE